MSSVTLNDVQTAVLRWIGEGCPDGVMEGYAHRISASAPRARGLVRISGRGPSWRVELSDTGKAHLAALEVPVAPAGTPAGNGQRPEVRTVSKTEQLVRDVIAAGGKLSLADETAPGGVNWRQRAYAAQRHGKVPDGKHLSVAWTNAGFEIELCDGATGNELGAEPVVCRSVSAAITESRRNSETGLAYTRCRVRRCRARCGSR